MKNPGDDDRLNTVNLIRFDSKRQKNITFYQKIMRKEFRLDIRHVKIMPDHYKYYILVASQNMIVGFNYENYKLRPEYADTTKNGLSALDRLRESKFLNYHFYNQISNFKCLHPALIFFESLNRNYNFCFIHQRNSEYVVNRVKFVGMEDSNFNECLRNKPLLSIMKTRFNRDYITKVELPDANAKTFRDKIKKKYNHFFLSINSEIEAIAFRSKVYLEQTLRKFDVRLINHVSLKLPFSEYFPYTLSAIQPRESDGFRISVKTHKQKKLVFLRELRQSTFFVGMINSKSSGVDILNLFLIQGGRNVLFSNIFQTKVQDHPKHEQRFPSQIDRDREVHQRGTFVYQVQTKAGAAKDINSFQSALNLTNFYFKEFGLNIVPGAQDSREKLREYWRQIDQEQKSLSTYSMDSEIIRVGRQDKQGDCQLLQDTFLFRQKKNLIELATLKSEKRGNPREQQGPDREPLRLRQLRGDENEPADFTDLEVDLLPELFVSVYFDHVRLHRLH